AGIDWVLYHAREYNIRVLNVSLASDSTDSYLTDPLCRAVRNAVASGITVVVAAGNYGMAANGGEVYGTITAPGNEPSANAVGALQLAASITPDVASRISAGTLHTGDSILAPGKTLPAPVSVIEGRNVTWSRIVFMGGRQILSGDALFTKLQAPYRPRIAWV